ncbi:DUF6886 family protein [Actibacterium sp. 188UL27-1]|uniref:DUF6886 family protein n=1 Tax=Actibacterium sp. 188UL27-1 TaxID=2786961 RepID=UPI00351CB3B2
MLFHFSDDPTITEFVPRSVRVPVARKPGQEWLNGPLVWAIEEAYQALYLFPRDCPRILVWPTATSQPDDIKQIWRESRARMIAYVEHDWMDRIAGASLWRYDLPNDNFLALGDVGMWVSHDAVIPKECAHLRDLPGLIEKSGSELRVTEDLSTLRSLWTTSLHVSGIRLKNAKSWQLKSR